jgi:glycosyltransferase involved in cell wall biosynthesis
MGGLFAKEVRMLGKPAVVSVHGLTKPIAMATLSAPRSDLFRYLTWEEFSYLFLKGNFIDRLRYSEHLHSAAIMYDANHLKDLCERLFIGGSGIRRTVRLAVAINNSVSEKNDRENLFCYGGRLLFSKGASYAVEALGHVVKELDEAKLIIYGRGPIEAKLKSTVKRLGLSGHVKFAGFVSRDQYLDALSKCCAIVLPSFYEICPLAILEAQAQGIPATLFRFPWTGEFVRDGKNGYSVTPFDTEKLAKAMLKCAQTGMNSRSIREESSRFTVEEMTDKIEDVYASVT